MKRLTSLTLLATALLIAQFGHAQEIDYDAQNGNVYVYGTNQNDSCEVDEKDQLLSIRLYDANHDQVDEIRLEPEEVSAISFFGFDGADDFVVQESEDLIEEGYYFACYLYGGDGLDYLQGGPFENFLSGGYDKYQDILVGTPAFDTFVRWYRVVEINGKTTTTVTSASKLYQWKYQNGIAPATEKIYQDEVIQNFDRSYDEIIELED